MMQPHIPDTLPLKNIDRERHVTLIGKANAALARYDGILLGCTSLPNARVFSSRIAKFLS